MDDFFTKHRVFTTTQARKAGIKKQYLRSHADIVMLGTFPVPDGKHQRLEKFYTFNPYLARLAKHANKLARKQNKNDEELGNILNTINNEIRKTLGWDKEGEPDDGKQEDSDTENNERSE